MEFKYVYNVAAILEEFPFINPGKLAEYLGLNKKDMQNYRKGRIFIGEKWEARVRTALREIAHRLCEMTEPQGDINL